MFAGRRRITTAGDERANPAGSEWLLAKLGRFMALRPDAGYRSFVGDVLYMGLWLAAVVGALAVEVVVKMSDRKPVPGGDVVAGPKGLRVNRLIDGPGRWDDRVAVAAESAIVGRSAAGPGASEQSAL